MKIPQLKGRQAGFTMIELIVVMVILGILAAFAIPRFANLTGEARIATMKGAKAGVNSAVTITRSKWLAAGGTGTTVELEDGTEVTVSNGYPAATAAGICRAVQLDTSSIECTGTEFRLLSNTACKFDYDLITTGTPARTVGVLPFVVAPTTRTRNANTGEVTFTDLDKEGDSCL